VARVSVSSSGVPSISDCYRPSISGDGRYVAFESDASNLVTGDTNSARDIFVRDTVAGTTVRVSVDSSGAAGNGPSYFPSISGDGRTVAFKSYATNLVEDDTNGAYDIFVRNTETGTTLRVSLDSWGNQVNGSSHSASISADGRYVAFMSYATNLVEGDTNGADDIFVRDTVAGTTVRVSVASLGAQSNHDSDVPSISGDGRHVAFMSRASNLVPGDLNGARDIFVRDTVAETTVRISVDSSGTEGNAGSFSAAISFDGHCVAFESAANNLVVNDTNGASDIFVRDLAAGTTARVSVSTSGVQGNDVSHFTPSISADGRYVAFSSFATNLVSGDIYGNYDVFVRDTEAGTTVRVSVSTSGVEAYGASFDPSISADGRHVAFLSQAWNLVPDDTNSVQDVFVCGPLE